MDGVSTPNDAEADDPMELEDLQSGSVKEIHKTLRKYIKDHLKKLRSGKTLHCWRPVIPEIPKPVGQEVACLAKGIRASKIKNFVLYEIVCKFKIWIRFRREENLKFLLRFEWIQNRKSCSCFGNSKTLCL